MFYPEHHTNDPNYTFVSVMAFMLITVIGVLWIGYELLKSYCFKQNTD